MLTLEEAHAILSAVGSDSAPTADKLREARAAFINFAKEAKAKGDKLALGTLAQAIKASDAAIADAVALETEAATELEALAADIPELAEEPAAEVETPAGEALSAAPVQMLSIAEVAARLAGRPVEQVIEVSEPEARQTLTINGVESPDATWTDLGQAVAKFTKQSIRGGRTTLATFRTEYDNVLKGNAAANARILDDLSRRAAEPAVVAAGGCCSLAEPIRDQPMLASLARPIADGLPTIGATYGKVAMLPTVCLPQGGAAVWTCADDAAVDPEDQDTWKTCTEIECEDELEITLGAIYHCIEIGNFQQKFNPERWDAILHAVAAEQARIAEAKLFNDIITATGVTQHTVTDTGSVYVTFVQSILRAWATIKQNQRYEGLRAGGIAPSWLRDAADLDMVARAISRGRAPEFEGVDALLRSRGIDIIWSPDINPIEPNGQVSGPLTAFPATADVALYVDGGVFRLDGGEINMGTEVRDHDLNRQNKVAAFGESFEAALVRACDTKRITIPVTVCDEAACVAAPAPGSSEDNPLYTLAVTAP